MRKTTGAPRSSNRGVINLIKQEKQKGKQHNRAKPVNHEDHKKIALREKSIIFLVKIKILYMIFLYFSKMMLVYYIEIEYINV
jgi:hypothetical protein